MPLAFKNHNCKRMLKSFFLINTLVEGQLRDIARERGVSLGKPYYINIFFLRFLPFKPFLRFYFHKHLLLPVADPQLSITHLCGH